MDVTRKAWPMRLQNVLAAVIVVAATLGPAAARGQSQSLIEQARKEGEVVYYSTMSVPVFEILHKAAKEKYPFINFQHVYLVAPGGARHARISQRQDPSRRARQQPRGDDLLPGSENPRPLRVAGGQGADRRQRRPGAFLGRHHDRFSRHRVQYASGRAREGAEKLRRLSQPRIQGPNGEQHQRALPVHGDGEPPRRGAGAGLPQAAPAAGRAAGRRVHAHQQSARRGRIPDRRFHAGLEDRGAEEKRRARRLPPGRADLRDALHHRRGSEFSASGRREAIRRLHSLSRRTAGARARRENSAAQKRQVAGQGDRRLDCGRQSARGQAARRLQRGDEDLPAAHGHQAGPARLLLLAAALLLCVGAPPAARAQTQKIRLSYSSRSNSVTPFQLAAVKGFYREEGLDVEMIQVNPRLGAMAVMNGDLDFTTTFGSTLRGVLQGLPLKFVAVSVKKSEHFLITRRDIKDVQDLKGKKIAVSTLLGTDQTAAEEIMRSKRSEEHTSEL